MMDRLFSPLAFAGPFRGPGIGVCRTFFERTIGVCRTFFREGLPVDGFAKRKTGIRFAAYKAYVFTKRLFSKEGSGLRPACLKCFRYDEGADCRSSPHEPNQLERKRGASGRRWMGRGMGLAAARSPGGRLPWRSAAGCWRAERDRPLGLGKPRKMPRCEGQSVAAAPRQGGCPTRWHSFLMTDAATTRPVAASYRRPATPCPHYAGPTA
jgi:hypothetical protein